MKILHIVAHLGGGVGKAHAALCAASGPEIKRHYVLLEAPRDRRYADQLLAAGACITETPDSAWIAKLAAEADIVQIEWWNHPRLYEALCRTDFPPMRTVFWCHISGLFAPLIPSLLFRAGHRFVFTSDCSFEAATIATLPADAGKRLSTVSSGFGFEAVSGAPAVARHPRNICYLGTLDFAKMSPSVFDVIDAVDAAPFTVSMWGAHNPEGQVANAAAGMQHPERVLFKGHAADPEAVLRDAGIFLYLLQPQHYGTAENALLEAMSLGCVPLCLANPAEKRIVEHGITGFTEHDVQDAARRLGWMLQNPQHLTEIGANAMAFTAEQRTAQGAVLRFGDIYRDVLAEEKRGLRFSDLLGTTAARWFLSTQIHGRIEDADVAGLMRQFSSAGAEAKGSLAHFRGALPHDPSLQV